MVSAKQKANWARFAAMSRANAKARSTGSGKTTKGTGGKGGHHSKKHKTPIAATIGVAKTVWDVETGPDLWGAKNTLGAQRNAISHPEWRTYAVQQTYASAKRNSGPALIGLAISYGDKVPVVGKLYKPIKRNLDSLARQIFGKDYKA